MKEIYNLAKICPYSNKPYDPHIPRMYPTDYQEPTYQPYQLANQPYQHYQPYTEGRKVHFRFPFDNSEGKGNLKLGVCVPFNV